MNDEARDLHLRSVESLLTAFGHAADTRDSDALAALFLPDGVLAAGQETISGREAIAEFNAHRFATSKRATRHVWSNLRVDYSADDALHAVSIQQTFDQSEPEGPAQLRVSDVFDTFRRNSEGHWRFASRKIKRVFTAA